MIFFFFDKTINIHVKRPVFIVVMLLRKKKYHVQVEAKYALDLVAKFYYSRRKLVWEILHNGLKNKIEIQWKDILAIRAITEANKPGIFEIEVFFLYNAHIF